MEGDRFVKWQRFDSLLESFQKQWKQESIETSRKAKGKTEKKMEIKDLQSIGSIWEAIKRRRDERLLEMQKEEKKVKEVVVEEMLIPRTEEKITIEKAGTKETKKSADSEKEVESQKTGRKMRSKKSKRKSRSPVFRKLGVTGKSFVIKRPLKRNIWKNNLWKKDRWMESRLERKKIVWNQWRGDKPQSFRNAKNRSKPWKSKKKHRRAQRKPVKRRRRGQWGSTKEHYRVLLKRGKKTTDYMKKSKHRRGRGVVRIRGGKRRRKWLLPWRSPPWKCWRRNAT